MEDFAEGRDPRAHIKENEQFDWVSNILSPIIASAAANLVLQPFDLVKMKMQTTMIQNPSIIKTAKNVFTEAGIAGFYRGTAVNFLGGGLISSFRWTLYKNLYHRRIDSPIWSDGLMRIIFTSLSFGLLIPLFVTPVDHARIRVNFAKSENYTGQFDALQKIYKGYGLRKGLYKANSVTITRDFVYYMVFFTVFEQVQAIFDSRNRHSLGLSVASVVSALSAWTACYPFDSVKTVLQSDSLDKPKWNFFSYLASLKAEKRLNSLYNGLFSVLIRSAPVNLIFFTVWDRSLTFFKRRSSHH